MDYKVTLVIVELQLVKLAIEAPLVRKICNPSSQENVVITSRHGCLSSVETLEVGGRGGILMSPAIPRSL